MDSNELKARSWTRIEDAIRRIKPYYATNTAGGVLHIALDDGNMEADNVMWCLHEARKEGDDDAVELCHMLLDMSLDERYELYENHYDRYAL